MKLKFRGMAPSLGKLWVYPSGVVFLGAAVVLYGLQHDKLPLERVQFAKTFSKPVSKADNQVVRATPEECDCLPLWQCMTSGQDDCSQLERELRLCMERNKKRPAQV